MTETRRPVPESPESFAANALAEIEDARRAGALTPEEIAEALNRGGFPDFRGRQWDAEKVLEFMASPAAERARKARLKGR